MWNRNEGEIGKRKGKKCGGRGRKKWNRRKGWEKVMGGRGRGAKGGEGSSEIERKRKRIKGWESAGRGRRGGKQRKEG